MKIKASDIDQLTFRCSSLGAICTKGKSVITDKQLAQIEEFLKRDKLTPKMQEELDRLIHKRDNPELSATAKTETRLIYRSYKYQRSRFYTNKYIEKGIREEERGIDLLAIYKGIMLRKNTERLFNKFVQGEPDVFEGTEIRKAIQGWDTKLSWDIFTFPFKDDPLPIDYEYQNHGYLSLCPDAKRWTTSYTLVNAPANLIQREKEKVFYSLGSPTEESPELLYKYLTMCMEIEKNLIFDMPQFKKDNQNFDLDVEVPKDPSEWEFNIPMEERIVEFPVERDDRVIQSIYDRVIECREYIKDELL